MHAIAFGPSRADGRPPELIPPERMQAETEAQISEESDFWRGSSVSIRLMVELPFWLMIPECETSATHERATVRADIKQTYMAVYDGPEFLGSQVNVVFIGPNEVLKVGREMPPTVATTQAAVYRPMKTVLVFQPEAMEDAVLAAQQPPSAMQLEGREVRRINRGDQYLQSLAYAHLPVLNHLIADYRAASRDPFAFKVSQWNVPVWFVEYDGKFVPVCIMPYASRDWYPTLGNFGGGERSPFYAAEAHTVEMQAREDLTPGTLELLDARNLLYRGHVADAVRSAVTSIEVALEGQIIKLLRINGWAESKIQDRLAETWNNFDARVADYERISGTRIPGPVLSDLPHINGIRLKSELSRVRRLRHKIVHEGRRVDSHSRGPMIRDIETMMWLFQWLSWEAGKAEENSKSYAFFEAMRGMGIPRYPVEYRDSGVVVVPGAHPDGQVRTDREAVREQYLATIDGKQSDIDLFTRMSLRYLGIDAEDSPPPADDVVMHERYYINCSDHPIIVFCFECDAMIDSSTIKAVDLRLREYRETHGDTWSALCVINHQKTTAIGRREVARAISDEVNEIATRSGITLITAPDLCFLVQGAMGYGWDIDQITHLMSIPGRQGIVPPLYDAVGKYNRFFPNHSVISVELYSGKSLELGDIIGCRLSPRYVEQEVKSLQVERESVSKATGPCKVGIVTKLKKSHFEIGQTIFSRTT